VELTASSLHGYRISQSIYVAAKLGIADVLKDGPKGSDELATSVGANPDALHRLLRVLASMDIFAQVDQSRFSLTPLGALLQTDAPGSLWGTAVLTGEWWWQAYGELLLRSVIHDWDDAHAVAILKNCHHAMQGQGKLILVERVMPERAEHAPQVVLADLEMLVMTPGGRERTEAEFRVLFAAAGFKPTHIVPTQSELSIIEGVPV
jgi:hypothetical protein